MAGSMHFALRRWMFLLAGSLSGALAATLFLTMHAALLRPIWFSLPLALATGGIAGALVGYAFGHLFSYQVQNLSLERGTVFGVLLWAALLPPSVAELALKTLWPTVPDTVDVPMVLAGLILPAALLAWRRTRSLRSATVAVLVVVPLFIVTGGPLGPAQFRRGAPLIAGLLPIFATAGACLAGVLRTFACFARQLHDRAA